MVSFPGWAAASSDVYKRQISISLSFSPRVPWEKLSRATSSPARTSSRKTGSWLQEGPRVATIDVYKRQVPDCRTWERLTSDRQIWERRIWIAWGRWAGHLAQESHCALLRRASGESDREPANDWRHKRMEALGCVPEHDLGDDPAPSVPGRDRARPAGRAAGTVGLPL